MKRAVVLIGGGEHARVVAEVVRSRPEQLELRGFVDPAPCEETVRRLGIVRLGDESVLTEHRDAFGVIALAALGTAALRERIAERFDTVLRGWAVALHENAWVSSTAHLGQGAVVMAGAIVQSGARVGDHAIVNSAAVVEHDVELGAFAHVGPSATVGGGARIGRGSFVGLGACIRDHIAIGSDCVIGMGSVVVRDVADGAVVKGTLPDEP